MTVTATLDADDLELPWGRSTESKNPELLHVVIAWSLDEPRRIGEIAAVPEARVLGRGPSLSEDPAARLVFTRQRPGQVLPQAPLVSARVSRLQLVLTPQGEAEALEVENRGRCPLLVRGVEVERARVGHGDVLVLRNTLVLLVIRRRRDLVPARAWPADRAFAFGQPDPFGVVGESAAAWALRDALASVARTRHHVLIRGDSGVGKELAARAIHGLSERASHALVTRNAATIPDGLVDAELFGNVKNYPHAGSPERPGLIGEADGGTLFLDEIGELSERMQAHLLRVLDHGGEHQRLGEARVRTSDLRLVAATNRPIEVLKHDVAARLTGRLEVPGLDARREDVPLLVRHLLGRAASEDPELAARLFDRGPDGLEPRLEPQLVEALLRHPYSHNLRELERLLFDALLQSREGYVTTPPSLSGPGEPEAPAARRAAEEPIEDPAVSATDPTTLDREAIEAALREAAGSTTVAARRLGLRSRFTLYRLMKRLGISTSDA